jgi:ABC-type phosphate transport system substrate-binding protein
MKTSIRILAALAFLLCAALLPVLAADGFIVIASEGAPVSSLTAAQFKDMLTGKSMYWEGGQAVAIVYIADKTDAALKEYSGMDTSSFKTFWQRLTFSGRGQQPKKAGDGAEAVSLVAGAKGAIAIVPAGTELKGVKQIEIK